MNDGLTESELKVLFKQAMTEVLEERRDLFYELFAEVIEDVGLMNAMREAETGETVDEATIFAILGDAE